MTFSAHRPPFEAAAAQIAKARWFGNAWLCKTGLWPDAIAPTAMVLKLLKPHWSDDSKAAIVSASGIFFSIWVDEPSAASGRLRYNLHALKLRGLKGYKLESRKFATAFRASFESARRDWPNVRTDFGPQTLFEGFVESSNGAWTTQIVELAGAFHPLGDVIDELLSQSRIYKLR